MDANCEYIKINDCKCNFTPGESILDIARTHGINIPNMCHIQGLPQSGACSICVVEVVGTARLLRACATPAVHGMTVHTFTQKVIDARRRVLDLMLSTHGGDCIAPCALACPAGTNCQGYTALVAAGKPQEAAALARDAHPFPASLARICPRPCEDACRRGLIDSPVNLAGIKRFVADNFVITKHDMPPVSGKNIAIIGGGPAGLTAAYFLRRAGHAVAVYEKGPKMGGLLQYGIPEYRLPKGILDAEINAIANSGIQFYNNWQLGTHGNLNSLLSMHDAVIIATGAGISKPIWCEGENEEGVYGGLAFLEKVAKATPPQIGDTVVVVGGSNTAMDAARTALRLGAHEVFVSYRRTRDEMPADSHEIEAAMQEGVQFLFLTAPLKIKRGKNGSLTITLQNMQLGAPDASGRRAPVQINGKTTAINTSTIVAAVGQDVNTTGLFPLSSLIVDTQYRTSMPGVYAIGDVTGTTAYAIDAIAQAKHAAAAIGADICMPVHVASTGNIGTVQPGSVQALPRQEALHVRSKDFTELAKNLSPAQALQETARCLKCGCNAHAKCKLLALCVEYDVKQKSPVAHVGLKSGGVILDKAKCIHCYKCVTVCTHVANKELLSASYRGYGMEITKAFNRNLPQECAKCCKCVEVCPTGALVAHAPTSSCGQNLGQ